MAFFGLGKKKKKTTKKPASKTNSVAQSEATVSVFANMDKIRPLQNGQERWDEYVETLAYPYDPVVLEGEEGYIIVLPNNDAALQVRDEINGIMGLRRAAKFVAAEDYNSTSLTLD